MTNRISVPSNPDSQECVKNVMNYLADISFDKMITGQHTQTMAQEELHHIRKITGKEPALLGFELLSYSPNINYTDTDDECMKEVEENYGTLKRAWEWADRRGLITFTWHWFSPLGGHGKAFYSDNTDFDASRAVIAGTPENTAFISDLDYMAGLLRPFCDKKIPIIWRPFHEGDGNWFWWGSKGAETVKKLYQIMYQRYTSVHKLTNLIWVWNATNPACYPGDDMVDIISSDMYPAPHQHTACITEYERITAVTAQPKITLISEIGSLPDPDEIHKENLGWAGFMTWSKIYCLSEEFTSFEYLKKVYDNPLTVTLDELPKLLY